MRQVLFKLAEGDESKWMSVLPYALWSERVTPRKRMGCSPYFALTGCHPVIPLDIIEATWFVPPPAGIMSTEDLILRRALALRRRADDVASLHRRVFDARNKAALNYERNHAATISTEVYDPGSLVLVRNTAIEKALNRKMRPRYLGPLIVVARNRGGAYVLAELDGTVLDRPVAAFRVLKYMAREKVVVPEGVWDVSRERLEKMKQDRSQGDKERLNIGPSYIAPVEEDMERGVENDDDDAYDEDEVESLFLAGDGQYLSGWEDG